MLNSSSSKFAVFFKCVLSNARFKSVRNFHTVICQNYKLLVGNNKCPSFVITCASKYKFSDKRSLEDSQNDSILQEFLKEIKKDFGDNTPMKESSDNVKNEETGLAEKDTSKISQSIEEKFQKYRDEDADVILSSEEKMQPITTWKEKVIEVEEEKEFFLYQEKTDKLNQYSEISERGKTGAFDIEQLIHILREEKLDDIAVIKVPVTLKYCDYMVLATAKSKRHLQAVTEFIRRIHKKKKLKSEPYLKIEGKDSSEWKVLDMINIVLHIFLADTREYYDIESLWTVGEKYDTLCNKKPDLYEDLLEQQMEFLKQSEPLI